MRPAVTSQMGQHPDQVHAGAAMPDHRHPQRPIAMEVEPRERPGIHEIGRVPRYVGPIGVIGGRQDVQAHLPRPGYLFAVLDVSVRADEKLRKLPARDYGILWTPMSFFYLDGGGGRAIWLSCSALATDQIDEGVRRLAALIADARS